jgi:hypothetical protein
MNIALAVLYFSVLLLLSTYGLHRLHLVLLCRRHGKALLQAITDAPLLRGNDPAELPHVTIQLPLFNESTVAPRLLEAVAKMDYPAERLEIQVLDDSTDETQALCRAHVERLRERGLDIVYIHRVDRTGYKAGALGKGAEAERHKRLQDLAVKKAAEQKAAIDGQATEAAAQKTGEDLVKVGYAYASMGQADKGITLIEQGIAKGGLRNAEDAKLRLGLAQLGRDRAKGVRTLQSVKGNDGTADVARLWTLVGG